MGAHNLVVSEITKQYPNEKGEKYINCVEKEFKDMANEGVGGKDIVEVKTGKEE